MPAQRRGVLLAKASKLAFNSGSSLLSQVAVSYGYTATYVMRQRIYRMALINSLLTINQCLHKFFTRTNTSKYAITCVQLRLISFKLYFYKKRQRRHCPCCIRTFENIGHRYQEGAAFAYRQNCPCENSLKMRILKQELLLSQK